MCDDFICTVHGMNHVAECACPPVEYWAEHGLHPYDECSSVDVGVMLEKTRGWENEEW